ncbi:MAG: hypothetical protein O2856_02720, partial [Planctomycetota bacterium]|nr:hypothetical protein [Planctomycetota bacterium]
MKWIQSRLFWKIVGLYACLSLLALIGLLLALHARQSSKADAEQTQEIQRRLGIIRDELGAGQDPEFVIASWQGILHRDGQRIWLVDQDCHSLTDVEIKLPVEITLQSVVQSALRFGRSSRRIRIDSEDVLASALDASSDEEHRRILLTVIRRDELLGRQPSITSAATRTAIFTWVIGVFCVAFVAGSIVSPLQA